MADLIANLRKLDVQDDHWVYVCANEAADEIERLRAGGCARDQTTTQFCAEALALQDEIARLREALEKIASVDGVQAGPDKDMYRRWRRVATNAIDVARAALAEQEEKR